MFRYLVTKFVLISAAITEPQWPYSDWEYIWPLHVRKKRAQKQLSVLSFWIATTMLLVFTIRPLPKLSPTAQTYISPFHGRPTQSIPHPSPSSQTHTISRNCKRTFTHIHILYAHTGIPPPPFRQPPNLWDRSNLQCSLVNSSSFLPVITHSCGL